MTRLTDDQLDRIRAAVDGSNRDCFDFLTGMRDLLAEVDALRAERDAARDDYEERLAKLGAVWSQLEADYDALVATSAEREQTLAFHHQERVAAVARAEQADAERDDYAAKLARARDLCDRLDGVLWGRALSGEEGPQ